MEKKNNRETKKIEHGQENLTLLLKEKDQEIRIAKQRAGFFARKQAELLTKTANATSEKQEGEQLNSKKITERNKKMPNFKGQN